MAQINPRELVLDMLMEIEEKKAYSNLLIRNVLDKYDYLDARDKSFIKRLTEGTIERGIQLDYIINQISKTKTEKMKVLIRCLLRMSTYQILFMDNVPDSAACNEAVKLAGKRGFRSLQGFVNGVLRNISRGHETPDKLQLVPDKSKNFEEYLVVNYSMPLWIVQKWIKEYGNEVTETILKGLLEIHPVTIRVRDKEELLVEEIRKQGVTITKSQELQGVYQLSGLQGIRGLYGYEEGLFQVQDISSMLPPIAAGIIPGDVVLDLCAAPGGKSILAADLMKGKGTLISRDLSQNKTELILENAERLQFAVNKQGEFTFSVEEKDATVLDSTMLALADVVLADVPCSGLGILGKKRDIKYRLDEKKLEEIISLQRQILKNAWQYVKPGKILMFSTCTINKEENQDNVKWLTENSPLSLESMEEFLPEKLTSQEENGMLQLLPGKNNMDGFFLAKLRRNE